jgi:hypothetical protein
MPLTKNTCGAKTRSGGECTQPPMPNGRCRLHGGKSLRGVEHPNFQHGRYAKDLLPSLQQDYCRTLADPRILALKDEISLLSARVHEVLRTGESGQRWRDVKAAWNAADMALQEGDVSKLNRAMGELGGIIHAGLHDWNHWTEIGQLLERLRRLKTSEHRHRVDARLAITQEQLSAEIAAVLDILRRNIKDRDTLHAINEELRRLVSGDPDQSHLN